MSKSSVPGGASHGVINPPNVQGPAGSKKENSFMPLTPHGSPVNPPNYGQHGDRREGTHELTGHASTMSPPNNGDAVFQVGTSKMPQPPSAVSPGKPSIPNMPFAHSGKPAGAMPVADMKRPPRKP